MCLLKIMQEEGLKADGIGFKVVRKTGDGGYAPYYRFFKTNGKGGLTYRKYENLFRTRVTYRVGRWSRGNPDRIAFAESGQAYQAGIHVWKRFSTAYRMWKTNKNLVVIKVRWECIRSC